MNIKLTPDQDITELVIEGISILNNMRKFQKKWEESYGVELRHRKKYWEDRADEYLKKLGASDELGRQEKINIV